MLIPRDTVFITSLSGSGQSPPVVTQKDSSPYAPRHSSGEVAIYYLITIKIQIGLEVWRKQKGIRIKILYLILKK